MDAEPKVLLILLICITPLAQHSLDELDGIPGSSGCLGSLTPIIGPLCQISYVLRAVQPHRTVDLDYNIASFSTVYQWPLPKIQPYKGTFKGPL